MFLLQGLSMELSLLAALASPGLEAVSLAALRKEIKEESKNEGPPLDVQGMLKQLMGVL